MALLPLDPSLGRALLAARELKCLEEVGGGPGAGLFCGRGCRCCCCCECCQCCCCCCCCFFPQPADTAACCPPTPNPLLSFNPPVCQMMTVAAMLSPESSVFLGNRGPEQLAAGEKEGAACGVAGGRQLGETAGLRQPVLRAAPWHVFCFAPSLMHPAFLPAPPHGQASPSGAAAAAAAGPRSARRGASCCSS